MTEWIELETREGNPVQASGWKITPLSRALKIKFPFLNGGLVWNRPSSIIVEGPDQLQRTIQVEDTTRLAQIAIVGAVFSTLLIFVILSQARR
jgi:hypothetical protein